MHPWLLGALRSLVVVTSLAMSAATAAPVGATPDDTSSASGTNMTGGWVFTLVVSSSSFNYNALIVDAGGTLKGAVSLPGACKARVSGSENAGSVTIVWSWVGACQGEVTTLVGSENAGFGSGTWSDPCCGSGTWSAVRGGATSAEISGGKAPGMATVGAAADSTSAPSLPSSTQAFRGSHQRQQGSRHR